MPDAIFAIKQGVHDIDNIYLTAHCDSEYEWGVHAAFFTEKAGLRKEQIGATLDAKPDSSIWSASEALLIELADELHDSTAVSDALCIKPH